MTRGEARFNHLATVLVGGTGLVYGWMRYFAEPGDEFALVNHPWQPFLQEAHILTAPMLVVACAFVWREHVWKRLRHRLPERRRTGRLLAFLFAPMVLSGYLLQTSASETWRTVWIVVHAGGSTLWLLLYVVHQLSPRGEPLPSRGTPRVMTGAENAEKRASRRVRARVHPFP